MSEVSTHSFSVDTATLERARAVCDREGTDINAALNQFLQDVARLDRLPWDAKDAHSLLVTPSAATQLSELMENPEAPGLEPQAAQMLRHMK